MKQRVVTGIIIIAVIAAIFYVKITFNTDYPFYFLGIFLVLTAMNELISMKETEKKLPFEIHLLSYLAVLYLSFHEVFTFVFGLKKIDTTDLMSFIFIIMVLSLVLRKNFKIVDASFMIFAVIYVGLTFHSMEYFLIEDYKILIYIIFIAMFTDIFAYFVGSTIGKHKLAPTISPKKTIEGSIGGSVVATAAVSVYAYFTIMNDKPVAYIIIITFLLTIMSQFGDLVASVMKRYFKIKDYGNLFPGHGGVLDRLDSILFTSLTFYYFLKLIELFTK